MKSPDGRDLPEATRILAGARRIAALTGAGISAESGVPTFRGAGGLWRGRPAVDLATPEAFDRDPDGVWEFYRSRIAGLRGVHPNEGHRALAALEDRCEEFWLITQNVDGLHAAAGSRNVIELHGSLARARCRSCATRVDSRDLPEGAVPRCSRCGDYLRPDVVWFGECLPAPVVRAAEEAVRDCEAMLVVGTSGVVEPAASLARRARSLGADVIEVNLERTPLSAIANLTLIGPSGAVLPRLVGGTG